MNFIQKYKENTTSCVSFCIKVVFWWTEVEIIHRCILLSISFSSSYGQQTLLPMPFIQKFPRDDTRA